ncbi:MAG TPA: alpha/beta hydrolase family protein [Vicinamibacterales bacterium]|jgi:dienelactone hydrolase|nr:alpha/beta hydrolase family protein [Vicinamibacterales bacterium]
MSKINRRRFCQSLAGTSLLSRASLTSTDLLQATVAAPDSPHIGNLYPFVQKQADRSPLELSFLQSRFRDLKSWQDVARARVLDRLCYSPATVSPAAEVIRRTDRNDYIEEYLTFQTTPDLRVPAYVLIPKNSPLPAPGLVVLHCHGGAYVWGKEKVVATTNEHPVLSEFKKGLYEGTSIANELVRRGYVVITIDMFYWGERRMLLDDDPASYRERQSMTSEEVQAFNRRSSQNEQLVARTLMTAGITWPGVVLWDDLRTLDYLASRPEVDRRRLGCVGLSVGGYRSFLLAALDQRIKAAVDVGWMTSYGSNLRRHVINTVGFTFHIPGLYRYLDLPDLAALIAPRSIFVINGSKDALFPSDGVERAFRKIEACYRKAGAPDRQRCRLYDAPHQFNREMQAEAWEWLGTNAR